MSSLVPPVIFVTVGTTSFDALASRVLSDEFLSMAWDRGFGGVILQYGNSSVRKQLEKLMLRMDDLSLIGDEVKGRYRIDSGRLRIMKTIDVFAFRFAASLSTHYSEASLVISHAGSGSIMEAMASAKDLIVVVNEALMDNHQRELAEELVKENLLFICGADGLVDQIKGHQINGGMLARWGKSSNSEDPILRVLDEEAGFW